MLTQSSLDRLELQKRARDRHVLCSSEKQGSLQRRHPQQLEKGWRRKMAQMESNRLAAKPIFYRLKLQYGKFLINFMS